MENLYVKILDVFAQDFPIFYYKSLCKEKTGLF